MFFAGKLTIFQVNRKTTKISIPEKSIDTSPITTMEETSFAHKNWITLRGMQLNEHAISNSIVTVLLHPLLPTTRYEKKVSVVPLTQ